MGSLRIIVKMFYLSFQNTDDIFWREKMFISLARLCFCRGVYLEKLEYQKTFFFSPLLCCLFASTDYADVFAYSIVPHSRASKLHFNYPPKTIFQQFAQIELRRLPPNSKYSNFRPNCLTYVMIYLLLLVRNRANLIIQTKHFLVIFQQYLFARLLDTRMPYDFNFASELSFAFSRKESSRENA